MTITKHQWEQIIKYSRSKAVRRDVHHNFDHIQRTVALAKYLSKREGGDRDVIIAGAWLHDIGRGSKVKDHAKRGAELARRFLKRIGAPEEFSEKVIECVRLHHDLKGLQMTERKEPKIVQDADQLQVTGPFGFMRHYSIHHDKNGHKKAYSDAKDYSKHVYKNLLFTATARRFIKKEYLFVLRFYDLVEKWERINNLVK